MTIFAAISAQMIPMGAAMFPIHERNSRSSICVRKTIDRDNQKTKDNELNLEISKPMMGNSVKDGDDSINGGNKCTQLSIFQNSSFLILCCMLFLCNTGTGILLIHFPAFCQEVGTNKQGISYVMASNGPALIVSRILIGILGNDQNVDKMATLMGLQLLSGVLFCAVPLLNLAKTVAMQITSMVLLGIYNGGSYSLLATLTIDIVGLQFLTTAFGVEMVCAGIGYLVGPPFSGMMMMMMMMMMMRFKYTISAFSLIKICNSEHRCHYTHNKPILVSY